MLTSTFDIVVVGMDLPALIYGALASKKGYRVLVVGHDPKDVIEGISDDIYIVRRPQLIYGIESSAFISETFADLAMLPEMRTKPVPYVPIAQIVMPGKRFDIHGDSMIMEKEWSREFPEDTDLIKRFFEKLEEVNRELDRVLEDAPLLPRPQKVGARLKTKNPVPEVEEVLASFEELMQEVASNEILKTALLALASGMALTPVPWQPFPISRLLWHLRNGLMRIDWGIDVLKKSFRDKIKTNAGEIKDKSHVTSVEVKGNVFGWNKGIRKLTLMGHDGQPEEVGASLVVLGLQSRLLLPVLSGSSNAKGIIEDLDTLKPSHYLFTIDVLLREEEFPQGMGDIVFLVGDPAKPLEDLNFMILQRNPAMAPESNTNPNKITLSLSVFMPASLYTGEQSFLRQYADMALARLRDYLMPFLPELEQRTFIPAFQIDHEKKIFIDEAVLYPIYTSFERKGLYAFKNPIITRFNNTLFLSEEVCGTLGFEGAFYTAREALRITRERFKRTE